MAHITAVFLVIDVLILANVMKITIMIIEHKLPVKKKTI